MSAQNAVTNQIGGIEAESWRQICVKRHVMEPSDLTVSRESRYLFEEAVMIPQSKQAFDDALSLTDEALADLELSRVSLTSIALKASRIARLLNDDHHRQLFQYEASGYPHGDSGYPPEIWHLLGTDLKAARVLLPP